MLAFARTRWFRPDRTEHDAEALAGLLWSKGIARLCNTHGPADYPFAPTESWQGDAFFGRHFANASGTVWVRLSTRSRLQERCDLDSFVAAALPSIREPFCLLTTDGDTAVPSQLRSETATALLESPFLRAWYTQNHDGFTHPKLRPFPIGLDLHTPRPEGDAAALAGLLRDLRELRVPLAEARPRVFCDLRLALSSPDRHDAVDALRGNRHAAMPWRRLSQGALWRRYAASPFVLSAVGNGIDCHRTYEALYLGCIVITKR